MSDLVTETVRTPRFRACCPTVTDALREFGPLWGTKSTQRVFCPSFKARKPTGSARKRDVPGIFVTDRVEVWHLSRRDLT